MRFTHLKIFPSTSFLFLGSAFLVFYANDAFAIDTLPTGLKTAWEGIEGPAVSAGLRGGGFAGVIYGVFQLLKGRYGIATLAALGLGAASAGITFIKGAYGMIF